MTTMIRWAAVVVAVLLVLAGMYLLAGQATP